MLRLVEMLNDSTLLIEAAISIIGLGFFCGMTYAMRWLPGRAMDADDADPELIQTTVHDFPEIHVLNIVDCSTKVTADKKEKEALAIE